MPERSDPAELLELGRDALGGIADLLVSINRGDLHQVDPGNLYSLLVLVRQNLAEASLAFERERKTA